MREVVTAVARPAAQRDGQLRRRVRAPRWCRARLRLSGSSPEGCADLHRRHRNEDDGARRRDRRRRRAQLPRLAGVQPAGDRGAAGRRSTGPVASSPTSTGRNWSCARCTKTAQAALDMARLMVTQYLGQQPHIMKASGVPQSLLDRVGEVLTWPATHEQVVAASKLVPDEIVQMLTASGTPAEARDRVVALHSQRLHLPDPVPARRRARHDRRLRRLDRLGLAGPPPCTPCRTCRRRASYPRTCCRCHVRRTRRRGRRRHAERAVSAAASDGSALPSGGRSSSRTASAKRDCVGVVRAAAGSSTCRTASTGSTASCTAGARREQRSDPTTRRTRSSLRCRRVRGVGVRGRSSPLRLGVSRRLSRRHPSTLAERWPIGCRRLGESVRPGGRVDGGLNSALHLHPFHPSCYLSFIKSARNACEQSPSTSYSPQKPLEVLGDVVRSEQEA